MIFNIGDGSVGNLVHIKVKCDSTLAGATITATNGNEVHTTTAPSDGGVLTINCKALGTWVITENLNNSSTSITAVYYGEYECSLGKPTGSTVTPINNVQTWLNCADISKIYTTISQVLNDVPTLSALISSENANDYLVRSTDFASGLCADSNAMTYIGANDYCANKLLSDGTWRSAICESTYFEKVLNVKVPTMTGYTTPSGEVKESSNYNTGTKGYFAFNGDTKGWVSNSLTEAWVQYAFTNPVISNLVTLNPYSMNSGETVAYLRCKGFKVQASNDGTNFTDLYSGETVDDNSIQSFNFRNENSYKIYRLSITSGNGYWFGLSKLNFYCRGV